VGDEELEIEMRVPRAAMKSIIGCKGAAIRKLSQESGARIDTESEEQGEEVTLLISGSPSQVCHAKAAIHRIVTESTPVSEQLCVPNRAVGRIIGRGGETVRSICRSSGAKVLCERNGNLAPVRIIHLSGTQKEVEAAKKLITEKLMEDNAFRKELAQSMAMRGQRKQPLGSRHELEPLSNGALGDREEKDKGMPCAQDSFLAQVAGEEEEQDEDEDEEDKELEELADGSEATVPKFEGIGSCGVMGGSIFWAQSLCPCSSYQCGCPSPFSARLPTPLLIVPSPDFSFDADEHLEVYVSAAENPNHFWIQLLGQRSLQLDKLTAEMWQHYESCGPTAKLSSVQAGDIVAAPYMEGRDWYRARVLGTLPSGNLDLYYVDFGDNGEAPLEALRALRSDFLSLPFQAIECSLTGVAPAGTGWDEAALDTFDRLTHCALWKPLVARITSYTQSGLGTWPKVRLYDTQHGANLDIGAELVRLGFAVACPQEDEERLGEDSLVTPVSCWPQPGDICCS
ncbi:TDRKH protein, partial [Upupa epops]|nr:TDRKH protein [Upupa epops]